MNIDDFQAGGEGGLLPLPPWAAWLIWLGQWAHGQASQAGRRAVIVQVPSRRTSAAFVAVGVQLASARLHDSELDWRKLVVQPAGTKVSWRERWPGDAALQNQIGEVEGTSDFDGQTLLRVKIRRKGNPTRSFSKATARKYAMTIGSVSTMIGEHLETAERFFGAALDGIDPAWLHSSRADAAVLTERSSFVQDLQGLRLSTRGNAEPLIHILALSDDSSSHHGKTHLLSERSHGVVSADHAVAVLDGAKPTLRLAEVGARSLISILDHGEYDEDIRQLVETFMSYAPSASIHVSPSLVVPPPSIRAITFGLAE